MTVSTTAIIAAAQAQLGKPYRFGATGPDAWDCSSLVQHAFAAAGVSLPRTTFEQVTIGRPISLNEIQPADLVFFSWDGVPHSHVALVVDADLLIEAPAPGQLVHYASLNPVYRSHVDAVRRVVNIEQDEIMQLPNGLTAEQALQDMWAWMALMVTGDKQRSDDRFHFPNAIAAAFGAMHDQLADLTIQVEQLGARVALPPAEPSEQGAEKRTKAAV